MTPASTGARLRRIKADDKLGLARGSVVVAIPFFGSHHLFVSCLYSVLSHTPQHIPILVADDASPDPITRHFLEDLDRAGALRHELLYLQQPTNVGFVENANSVLALADPADVVILNSDCEVGEHWLDLLRDAAHSDSIVATASALTNHGSLLSVPHRNQPTSTLPQNHDIDRVAGVVARTSRRLRPRIPTAVGHCMYIRRAAIDLVGGFDRAFSPGYGEEVDFSQRCVLHGLVHVAADDVFVYHRGSGTFHADNPVQKEHERVIAARYPYYHDQVSEVASRPVGPLARSLAIARVALQGLSVTIDARCLGPAITGTQVHVIELIHALARTRRLRLRAVVPDDMNDWFRLSLAQLDNLELLRARDVSPATPRTRIVHRPYQVFQLDELDVVAALGERFVVTNQDLISYRNPGYSNSFREWNEFHRVTRLVFSTADYVLFFSHHAAQDALAEDLVDERRVRVAHIGVDHRAAAVPAVPTRPSQLSEHADVAFLLCMGTNFKHKNRVFALRLLDELQRRHDWDGYLVFAGPHASAGSSASDEAAFLAMHPQVEKRTIDLHAVSEAEKAWLLGETMGVVYPSLYEGFGLVPFEAASYGAPCFFAAQAALTELLPAHAATIIQWDAAATADRIAAICADDNARLELVTAIRAAAVPLTWDRTAQKVLEVYELAAHDRDRDVATLAGTGGDRLDVAARVSARSLNDLALPPDVDQAFRALAARPAIRPWFFGLIRALYRLGSFMRRHRHMWRWTKRAARP